VYKMLKAVKAQPLLSELICLWDFWPHLCQTLSDKQTKSYR